MENQKQLIKALISMQKELKPVTKDATNPAFKSQYATIAAIIESVTPVLVKNGFALSQLTGFVGENFCLTTILLHESGESLSGNYLLNPAKKDDPQSLRATVTYARKAAIECILGLVTDDDDGNHASSSAVKPAETKTKIESNGTQSQASEFTSFIPTALSVKVGDKNGKPWTSYSVKDINENWYSTFKDDLGDILRDAKDRQFEVKIGWIAKGAFRNIVSVEEVAKVGAQWLQKQWNMK